MTVSAPGSTSGSTGTDGLVVDDVSYVVGRPLVDHVTVTFRPGRLTALSGPSGSGKTTLVSLAGGLLEPTSGEISHAGRPMWNGTGDPRAEVAYVLQVYGLVPILSALENVAVALRARGVAPREADKRAEAALEALHIADLADRQVDELSGGQLQRVALARGLAPRSRILFADEPTSELDEANRGIVMGLLRERADDGAIVVVATHDPVVAELCDDRYVMEDGVLSTTTGGHAEADGPAPAAVDDGSPPRHAADPPGVDDTWERPDDERPDGRSIWAR